MGGNALALIPDDRPLVVTLLNSVHTNISDDKRVVNTVLRLIRTIDAAAQRRNKPARDRFTKCAYKSQKPLESYVRRKMLAVRCELEIRCNRVLPYHRRVFPSKIWQVQARRAN